jgi:hypothetical protein
MRPAGSGAETPIISLTGGRVLEEVLEAFGWLAGREKKRSS